LRISTRQKLIINNECWSESRINTNKIYKSLNINVSMKKGGQVTIFIIIGIVIISAIALFLFFRTGISLDIGKGREINPTSFLDSCIEDKVKEAVEIISLQGGYISNPLHKTFKFEDEKEFRDISYLCYTQNYYVPCVNQEPMLIQHLEDEIKSYISDEVNLCFDRLTSSLKKQNYDVDETYRGFEVELMPKKVIINIDAELTLTKSGETSKEENFKIIIPSRFYDLAIVVQEIISQEARFCNFEYIGFMLLYPEFKIDKFRTSDSTIIYTIGHEDSEEKFRFAVRTCVIPPGF